MSSIRNFLVDLRNFIFDGPCSYPDLSRVMQRRVNNYFKKNINITEKALHALCGQCEIGGFLPEHYTCFCEDIILRRLVEHSPFIAKRLHNSGVDINEIEWNNRHFNEFGYPWVGIERGLFHQSDSSVLIKETGVLDEYMLFRSIVEVSLSSGNAGLALQSFFRKDPKDFLVHDLSMEHKETLTKMIEVDPSYTIEQNFEFLLDLDDKNHLKIIPRGECGQVVTSESIDIGSNIVVSSSVPIIRGDSSVFCSAAKIEELELLINSECAQEKDFQLFFENSPQLLNKLLGGRPVPHLIFRHTDYGAIIPDFIISPNDSTYVNICEIKTPKAKLVTSASNGRRLRLAQEVREGIAQLLEYRRILKDKDIRKAMMKMYGIRSLEPRLTLIIGRDGLLTQPNQVNLSEELPHDMEIITYDAILKFANKFKLL